MQIHELTALARQMKASDIHISQGLPLMFRIDGKLVEAPVQFDEDATRALIENTLDESHREALDTQRLDADFAIAAPDGTRSRVNVFYQQGKISATLRLLNDEIPTMEQLGLPPVLKKLADEPRGLILVTGPTGSGKSTTLASMIDYINQNRSDHILTIEDPIEYVYKSKKALIHQREVGSDVTSFAAALRSALREDPDVILVGEMRDYETISAAVTAAETGHLVMSTLHTIGAAQTIDRIIDVCPPGAQSQIRGQLSTVLRGVITQQLLPLATGRGRCAATEILVGSDAVCNLIRENKCFQIPSVLQSGAALGMHSLNGDLARLVEHNLGDPGGMAAVEADLHQELDHMVYDDHIQCCVLGCTHYPLVSDTIETLYPGLPLIDPAQQMAQELKAYLTRTNLLRDENLPGRLDVFTTGDVDEYALRARQVGLDPVSSVSYHPPMALD